MKILFATSEAVPFCKTGGLADVAGSLPQALAQAGNEVEVILPLYSGWRISGRIRWSLSAISRSPSAGGGFTAACSVWRRTA